MHGCAVAVLAFPKHGCLAPELPVGSFLGVEIFLKDLPRSIDEFERFVRIDAINPPELVVFREFDVPRAQGFRECSQGIQ